jgi:Tol biopolymer transport system component
LTYCVDSSGSAVRAATDIVDLEGNILSSPRGIPSSPEWGPDGDSLHYVDSWEAVPNLFAWPLDGSQPTRLTSFDDRDLSICGWSWSMDGKHLAVVRCRTESDSVIIRDFR